jgi:LPXTG-motif cell wall-anchored protein
MVDDSALIDHLAHDEDIFPAPEEGCPAGAAPTPAATATATPGPAGYPLPTGTATPEVEEFPIAGPDDGDDHGAAPGQAQATPTPPAAGGKPLAPESPRLAQARPLAAGRLPATGDDVRLILLAGFGLVLAGAGLRLQVR